MEIGKLPYTMVIDDQRDFLGSDYRARTLSLPSGSECTLISYEPAGCSSSGPSLSSKDKAILYIHGYTDYFFQTSMAEYFHELGFCFYALDLQGYGRSIRPNRKPTSCNSFLDYHQDLSAAFDVMLVDGITECVPLAHSMGGLALTSYLRLHETKHSQADDKAAQSSICIKGVILNSPFLALPLSPAKESLVLPIYRFLAKYFAFVSLATQQTNPYSRTLHTSLSGEWSYRLDWKPATGFPFSFAWIQQVMVEQALSSQAQIRIPTLLCHSSKSTYFNRDLAKIRQGDGVLNVENMEIKTKAIYQNLSIAVVEQGFHDLYLSPLPIRTQYLTSIATWLKENIL